MVANAGTSIRMSGAYGTEREWLGLRRPGESQSDRPWQLLGSVHHRLHHPHCPVRRPMDVQDPQRPRYRGVDHRCGRSPRGNGRRQLDSRVAARTVLLVEQGHHSFRPVRLRLHRVGATGMDAALPARLHFQLSQDRHNRATRHRHARGESHPALPDGQRDVQKRRPDVSGQHLSVCVHLHHVWFDQRLSCSGLVGNDAENDRQGISNPPHWLCNAC